MNPTVPMRCCSLLIASFAVMLLASCKRDAVDETGRVFRPLTSPDYHEPTGRIPLPKDWKLDTEHAEGDPTIVGPDGIKVFDIKYRMFSFPTDAAMRQVYRQTKQKKRRFRSMKQVIEEDFEPNAKEQGKHLVRTYELPELAKYDERFRSQLYEFFPSRKQFKAVATEWENAKQEPSLVVIRLSILNGQGVQNWGYFAHVLEAERSAYEEAKEDLLHALLNTEHNRAYIADYNRKEKQKSEASWRQHRRRMNSNQRRFEAQQRAFRENADATNEAIMDGWRERNAASDRAHDSYIDTIREEENVRDPSSGKTYKVESGSDQYWKNDQGEYIKSDDRFYNPNRDPNINNQDWTEMEKTR